MFFEFSVKAFQLFADFDPLSVTLLFIWQTFLLIVWQKIANYLAISLPVGISALTPCQIIRKISPFNSQLHILPVAGKAAFSRFLPTALWGFAAQSAKNG